MDGWLKGLIAAACVVVIAGGGYFAWSEWEKSKERERAEQRAMTAFCKQMVRDLGRHETKDYKGAHVAHCINQSFVSERDFETAGAAAYLDQFRDIIKPVADRTSPTS
jgi:predicted negative regulator of RcsB-dependent stress response